MESASRLSRYRKRKRIALQSLKTGPCVDCGRTLPPECMDFDHLSGAEKDTDVSRLVKYASMSKVADEIAKCELVCVLCHRNRTYHRAKAVTPDSRFGRYYVKKRTFVWAVKNVPCAHCGMRYQPWQMDLDHRDPASKVACRSTRAAGVLSMSLARLRAELPKLEVLCAACHRTKTFRVVN